MKSNSTVSVFQVEVRTGSTSEGGHINQLIPEIINSDQWRTLLFEYLGETAQL
ncbi:hypothetical protein [uncultured Desulfobacter sp.]|uniref:hypothetical protein n=1 Tax=uncultured Desulfobacter sp. TaxID=240139 RepID=UPI002AA6FB15|nr:hypothetical protein [uncultured Desulfobacter sp.]